MKFAKERYLLTGKVDSVIVGVLAILVGALAVKKLFVAGEELLPGDDLPDGILANNVENARKHLDIF